MRKDFESVAYIELHLLLHSELSDVLLYMYVPYLKEYLLLKCLWFLRLRSVEQGK